MFYVVRKGDVIGTYTNLSDCQAQVSNSVCDPSVSVFKGYSLRKETEEYLAARGLKNALYSINTADARHELFDDLALCPFQDQLLLGIEAALGLTFTSEPLAPPSEPMVLVMSFFSTCFGNMEYMGINSKHQVTYGFAFSYTR